MKVQWSECKKEPLKGSWYVSAEFTNVKARDMIE